jgi:3-hydroxyisobutyrate dehydrogenase-like beta-hydroxyacid dehydrogenase
MGSIGSGGRHAASSQTGFIGEETKVSGAVGLIGIGLMGTVLARRLLDAGYRVIGFDIAEGRGEELGRMGGEPVESLVGVPRRCQLYLIAVMTMSQVEDVVEGAGGLVEAGTAEIPRIALYAATCEPDRIEALAARTAPHELAFLDTPVSGTSQQVLHGDGFGLIAGDGAAAEAADPVLSVIYPRRHFVGPAGAATKTKLAINHILGLNCVALAEGLVFAETLGLDLRSFLEAARQSAAYSQIMDVKGDKMLVGDFPPVGKVSQHLKDVRVILSEAARRGQALPFASILAEVLEACERQGEGERDNAITIEEIRRRST